MAFIRTMYASVFLLALVACKEILLTHGRQLKSPKEHKNSSNEDKTEIEKHHSQAMDSHQNPLEHEDGIPAPGHTRSTGHSTPGKKHIFSLRTPDQSLGFGDPVDNFRSTTPGNSPGVGHLSEGHTDDVKPKAIGNGPSVSHSVADNRDDFRPTTPGHSPSIGHPFQDKNAEPNA